MESDLPTSASVLIRQLVASAGKKPTATFLRDDRGGRAQLTFGVPGQSPIDYTMADLKRLEAAGLVKLRAGSTIEGNVTDAAVKAYG